MKTTLNFFHGFLLLTLVVVMTSCSTSRTSMHRSSSVYSGSESALVLDARKLLKTRYKYGGNSPRGFDCSGFTQYLFQLHGTHLPRSAQAQSKLGSKVNLSDARPGDLLFFGGGSISHVGLVSRVKGKYPIMIHASTSSGVIETDINTSDYWRRRLKFVRRLRTDVYSVR